VIRVRDAVQVDDGLQGDTEAGGDAAQDVAGLDSVGLFSGRGRRIYGRVGDARRGGEAGNPQALAHGDEVGIGEAVQRDDGRDGSAERAARAPSVSPGRTT